MVQICNRNQCQEIVQDHHNLLYYNVIDPIYKPTARPIHYIEL